MKKGKCRKVGLFIVVLLIVAVALLFWRDYKTRQKPEYLPLEEAVAVRGKILQNPALLARTKPFEGQGYDSYKYFPPQVQKFTGNGLQALRAPDTSSVFEGVWYAPDGRIGFIIKSSGGIGWFRDYYHELLYDPRHKTQNTKYVREPYEVLETQKLRKGWKYRLVASPWD